MRIHKHINMPSKTYGNFCTLKENMFICIQKTIHVYVLLLIFIFMGSGAMAQLYFISSPKDYQLYPRDISTNEATITIAGTAELGTGNAMQLRVLRNDTLYYSETQELTYFNNFAEFSFQTNIQAELANYTFEIYTEENDDFILEKTINNVVAGDVYLITGQSNALSPRRDSAESAAYLESPYIRSFASGIASGAVAGNLNWYEGVADAGNTTNGNVGQWGIKMANLLINEYQIPIAVFNGAYGGTGIFYHTPNHSDPNNLNNSYGRLLYRLQQANVENAVRGILWYQGETDGKFWTSIEDYKRGFYSIYEGWERDCPNFEALYIMQVRMGCGGSRSGFVKIQEAQRQLANELPKTKLMTAKGISQWTDNCHFDLAAYEEIGERLAAAIMNDLYDKNEPNILPNDILSIEQIGGDTLKITMQNNTPVIWEAGAEADFAFSGTNQIVVDGWTIGNELYLKLSGTTNTARALTYMDISGYGVTGPYVTNTNGIGLPSFYDFPIGEPNMIAWDNYYGMEEDSTLYDNVLVNDLISLASGLRLETNPVEDVSYGTLELKPTGDFIYTPDEQFHGQDTFIYRMCSAATPVFCEEATVYITVNPVDEPPYAIDDELVIVQDNLGVGNVMDNDFEVDGDTYMINTIPVVLPNSGTVSLQPFGGYTYLPDFVFNGSDAFAYEICDVGAGGLCDTAWVYITVEDNNVNDAPIGVNDNLIISEDQLGIGNLLMNDWDPENDQILATNYPIDLPENGAAIIQQSGLYYYIPDADFYGVDSFSYQICDNGIPQLCSIGWATVQVNSVNDPPLVNADTLHISPSLSFSLNVLDNDYDNDGDDLFVSLDSMIYLANSILMIDTDGTVNYQPEQGFVGTEEFTYEICDTGTPSQCVETTLTLIVDDECVDIELYAWLEGAFDTLNNIMYTDLNTERHVLPGQIPANSLVVPTPPGQPYAIAPWNYDGEEGVDWQNNNYSPDVVDWVLVGFRTSPDPATTLSRGAAIINRNGEVTFPNRCLLSTNIVDSLYIVIEHRNHLGIMTQEPVAITNDTLFYDFRINDSYKDPTSYGQKQLKPGIWGMFAGDGGQESDELSYDINGVDKARWSESNGSFDYYLPADYNMDGDVNGEDKTIWTLNNGISSRVPR